MKKIIKNKKGFTLVEIIVVLIIMGILLAIAVPSVLTYVGKAEDQRDLSTARVGFVGAQTVVLQARAKVRDATDDALAAAIDVASIKKETSIDVNSINCIVADAAVTQCSIKLDKDGQFANFTANGIAEMSEDASVTGPNVPAIP